MVPVKRGLERGRFNRHHLLRGSLCGDRRQVDENCHAAPCGARSPFDRLVVEIDAILSGWLRRIETRQHQGRVEANDGLRGTSGHLRLSAEIGASALPFRLQRNRRNDVRCCQYIRGQDRYLSGLERSEAPRRERMHSRSKIRKRMARHESHLTNSTDFIYAPQSHCEQGCDGVLFLLAK